MKRRSQSKTTTVVDMSGDGSNVQCCKEQYWIGTWNVRSMNQGKLEVVKQEMARVNIKILGISELKQTGMGKFNSDDHYVYYCGQESLRRNGVAIIVNKRVWNAVKVKSESEVAQSCPTFCDPVDCSLPGFSIHGILQARILLWVTISFYRGSSQPRDWTWVSHTGGKRFNLWATEMQ